MSKLDPRVEAVRVKYDLDAADFWQIPQNKQWVCKHAALEVVATKANIEWAAPQIIEADTAAGIAVLAVTGKMGSRVEWSTGEASPKNNKNGYPWAMAEKRAKDRVVLKLVGIHGLVYSEDEMPADHVGVPAQPDAPKPAPADKPISAAEQKRGLEAIDQDLLDCATIAAVDTCAKTWNAIMQRDRWSKDYIDIAAPKFEARRVVIRQASEAEEVFPGDLPSHLANSHQRPLETHR